VAYRAYVEIAKRAGRTGRIGWDFYCELRKWLPITIREFLRAARMAHVEIIAMNPHDIMPVMANLTPEIKASFPELIAKTVHVLDAHDIKLIPKEKETTLDEIIDSFANPTQQIQIPNTKG